MEKINAIKELTAIKKVIQDLSLIREEAYSNATKSYNTGNAEMQQHWYKTADLIQPLFDFAYQKEYELNAIAMKSINYGDLL